MRSRFELTHVDDDPFAIVVVMWNGLEGADPWVLPVRVQPVVVIVTCQFGQRPAKINQPSVDIVISPPHLFLSFSLSYLKCYFLTR